MGLGLPVSGAGFGGVSSGMGLDGGGGWWRVGEVGRDAGCLMVLLAA
jgi:hypothetical protein